MKIILCVICSLFLFSTSYAQLDAADFEIFTQTTGSTGDTIRFWMLAEGPVWDKDGTSQSLDDQRLTSSFDSAHATHWTNEYRTGVPVPDSSNNYGLWHVVTGTSHPNHKFGYGKYKFLIGDEFNDPDMYFYLDYTDCDYSDGYHHNDTWIKYNANDTTLRISWDNDNFTIYDSLGASNHPTFDIWDYKAKKSGYSSGQNTDCFELYLSVSTQNDHPYLTWNAYDGRSGNNALDYYEIWKKGTGSYSLKDTTSNTYYEDTSEDATPPGSKVYKYYKIRAVELDADTSLFGNQVKKAVYEPREEGEAFLENGSSIISKDNKPTKYSLKQNYPNPFNPTTTISFDLPKEGTVQLEIFNVQGKVISTLVKGTMDQGNHNVRFNSSGLPSGVYFYRLQTQEFTDIKRMLLLK